MKLRKLTRADEFLKLDSLVTDPQVQKAIEDRAREIVKEYKINKNNKDTIPAIKLLLSIKTKTK